jgi:hypothetical protein
MFTTRIHALRTSFVAHVASTVTLVCHVAVAAEAAPVALGGPAVGPVGVDSTTPAVAASEMVGAVVPTPPLPLAALGG